MPLNLDMCGTPLVTHALIPATKLGHVFHVHLPRFLEMRWGNLFRYTTRFSKVAQPSPSVNLDSWESLFLNCIIKFPRTLAGFKDVSVAHFLRPSVWLDWWAVV